MHFPAEGASPSMFSYLAHNHEDAGRDNFDDFDFTLAPARNKRHQRGLGPVQLGRDTFGYLTSSLLCKLLE